LVESIARIHLAIKQQIRILRSDGGSGGKRIALSNKYQRFKS